MKSHLLLLAALAALFVFAMAPTAQAQICNGGYGYGYGLGYLYNSLDYNVPYFAAHPPVYYSYPVPRTYGYSPFAYPPGTMTPQVEGMPEPIQISNPYVPQKAQPEAEKTADTVETRRASLESPAEPLMIVNPYAQSNNRPMARFN
jgi:hypothetical protein